MNENYFKINNACKNGDIKLVKKLVKKCRTDFLGIYLFGEYYSKFLKYFSIQCTITTDAIYLSAENGNIELVEYLVSINAPIDAWAIQIAAKNGHLEIVKYLVSINAPINLYVIPSAVQNGNLDLIKYLISINAPIDSWAITCAIKNRRLDLVKYLLWNDAPYKKRVSANGEEYEINVEKLVKELCQELFPIISEFIGPDTASVIIEKFLNKSLKFS